MPAAGWACSNCIEPPTIPGSWQVAFSSHERMGEDGLKGMVEHAVRFYRAGKPLPYGFTM